MNKHFIQNKTVKLWHGEANIELLLHSYSRHTGEVSSVAYSPDGTTLATGSFDNSVAYFNAKTFELLDQSYTQGSKVLAIAWSPNSQTLASGGSDRAVKLRTGNLKSESLGKYTGSIRSIAYSSDGKMLAVASDRTVKLFKVE